MGASKLRVSMYSGTEVGYILCSGNIEGKCRSFARSSKCFVSSTSNGWWYRPHVPGVTPNGADYGVGAAAKTIFKVHKCSHICRALGLAEHGT